MGRHVALPPVRSPTPCQVLVVGPHPRAGPHSPALEPASAQRPGPALHKDSDRPLVREGMIGYVGIQIFVLENYPKSTFMVAEEQKHSRRVDCTAKCMGELPLPEWYELNVFAGQLPESQHIVRVWWAWGSRLIFVDLRACILVPHPATANLATFQIRPSMKKSPHGSTQQRGSR